MQRLDPTLVSARRSKLDEARAAIKAHFVGIDGVIDELCDAVTLWYLAPQILTRPVIVNLWGMTGVGKTDLVRRLASALDIEDHFVEIELSNGDSTTYHSSVASRLSESGALEGVPTLLLFDEIQRFNTLDPEGNPVVNTKFSDFWELLSDGRLTRREPPELAFLLATLHQQVASIEERRRAGETVDSRIGPWEAQQLRKACSLPQSIDELAQYTYEQAIAAVSEARASRRVYQPIDCTQSLIIISGNLDEAFTMAGQSAEVDIDADIFAAYTEKITLVDIKNALRRRFKPEQVARFGNTHLIYTSLKRRDFETLIDREIASVTRRAEAVFGVHVEVGDGVRQLVYRNGVFPVQGVRPVFSSVADIVETNLAKLVFDALMTGVSRVVMTYDEASHDLVGLVGEVRRVLPYNGRVDRIRNANTPDKIANVAVHESGHALMLALGFQVAPLQLTSRVASSYVSGFTFAHQVYETAASLVAQVKVLLAGGVAEELVFGAPRASVGRSSDRERATTLIMDFIRRHGFDPEFQAHYLLNEPYTMDRSVTDPDIEKMLARLAAETAQELQQHRTVLLALARALASAGSLTADQVRACLDAHGIPARVLAEDVELIAPYASALGEA